MKKLLLAGNFPFVAVLLLCATAFILGRHFAPDVSRIAVVERGAVVLEAALDLPGATKEDLRNFIEPPVQAVLKRYQDAGYLVIDASRDEAGNFVVAALPSSARDITAELREAIHKSLPGNAPTHNTASPQNGARP